MKDYVPVACFRNHETGLQSVEVTNFSSSDGSARAVRNNLWFVSVGSTCSPDHVHTTDVMKCRKDFDRLKCRDGAFYRLEGSCADPQNSELFLLYVMWDTCGSMNSVMLFSSLLFFEQVGVQKDASLLSCHSYSLLLSRSTSYFSLCLAEPLSPCVISGYCCEVNENWALLGNYAAK